jgi:biotin carboxyl carrier protein
MKKIDESEMKTIVLGYGAVKYKTLLTRKYLNRKPYEPVDPQKLISFIPGTILNVYVKKGQEVVAGEKLLILEAMKMKNEILSPFNGTIEELFVKEGERVPKNQVLLIVQKA